MIRTTTTSRLLPALVAGVGALLSGQEPRQALELFPRELRCGRPASDVPPLETLLPFAGDSEFRRDLLGDEVEDAGNLHDNPLPVRFLELAHAPELESGALAFDADEQALFVHAAPELLTRIRGELAAVHAAVARPIEVRAALYRLDDGDAPPTVARPGNGAGHGAPLWESRTVTRHGDIASFDAMRWTRYVQTVNVEVAQKQSVSNAVVSVFGEGICIAVQVHALAGADDLVLFAQFALGQRLALDSLVTGVPEQPNLDQPTLASTFGTAAARLANGGAMQLLLAADDGGGNLLLVLEPRFLSPPPAVTVGGVAIAPVSALTGRALRQLRVIPDGRSHMLTGYDSSSLHHDFDEPVMTADRLQTILWQAMGEESAQVELLEDHALLSGSPAAQAAALAAIDHLQARLLHNTSVLVGAEMLEARGGAPFAAPIDGGARRPAARVALPGLPGRQSFAFRGVETAAVAAMLPEIAQEAAILTPEVDRRQSGLWLRFCPPIDDAAAAFDLDAQLDRHLMPPPRSLGAGGSLQLGADDTLRAKRVQLLPPGRDVELARGTAVERDGRQWLLRLSAHRDDDSRGSDELPR